MVIDKWLREYKLTPTAADPCVYVMGSTMADGGNLLVALYVDDMIIAGRKRATIDQFKLAIAE
eukprot:43975-Eustigmatos_ZCMA.PRE.1